MGKDGFIIIMFMAITERGFIMGIFSKIFSGLFKSGKNTLLQDIYTYSEWIVTALNTSGYKADYTVDSMKELDRFIDEQNTETGIMAGRRGQIIFAMGA